MKDSTRRNLTLSLPADLIRSAKILAAKQGTSLNELIKQNLQKMVQAEDQYAAALRRILAASERGSYRTHRPRPTRAELYE